MAREASILITLRDQYSPGVRDLRNANDQLSDSMNDVAQRARAYEQRLSALVRSQGQLHVELTDARQALREAERAYRDTGEAADAEALIQAREHYEALQVAMRDVTQTARETQATLRDLEDQQRRLNDNPGDQGGGGPDDGGGPDGGGQGGNLLSSLGKAGLSSMLGDTVSEWANILVSSAGGSEAGALFSGALSGAGSGAAIGSMIAPGVGTAVGAVAGGLVGMASGAAQIFEDKDDAFKEYVQEAAEGQLDAMSASIASGSDTAAQRELDAIAFNKLLGEGEGDQYLQDLRTMAAATPMEYADLTAMSQALATGFGKTPERMLELMEGIGNAGSAVGTDAQGMATMAQALSRMQSSGKASLDYLNVFQERGVDVIGMLSAALGMEQAGIYDMISKGSISGTQAVDIIQQGLDQYAGAMDEMSRTYSGLTSTLADAQAEMDNAYGEGYNETRKQGLQEEIDWLSGESGALMQEANRAMGAWQAELENSKEQYVREAVDAVLNSEEYQAAMAKGTTEGYAEAGRMLAEAKVRGMNEYNASDGAQLMVKYELALAEGIREDTASNSAYYDAGYRKGQEYSKGMVDAIWNNTKNRERTLQQVEEVPTPAVSFPRLERQYTFDDAGDIQVGGIVPTMGIRYATGLARVPYNDYPALLHEGERVLTASEARRYSSGGSGGVTFTGNTFVVRQDSDIDAIAAAFLAKLQEAQLAGAYG